jgi:NAD(P)-dependent dehydrogenase (short-subunit alcohol dehydrogenase family)
MEDLEGRVAVVAGGSSGFGEQIAARFVKDGAKVVIAARDPERLEQVASAIGATGLACDITSSEAVRALATQTVERFGRLDIAVNSAGYEDNCPVAALEPERVEKMVAVQFTGALYFIQHMANAMSEGGSLITISSLTATLVAEGYAPYAGAKAGINHASRIAASEYGARGIRINVVSPSLIETPMTAHLLQAPGVADTFIGETPLGRIGQIDDVVSAVSFLSGDGASYITGQNLHIDGGTSLRRLPRAEDFIRQMQAAAAKANEQGS